MPKTNITTGDWKQLVTLKSGDVFNVEPEDAPIYLTTGANRNTAGHGQLVSAGEHFQGEATRSETLYARAEDGDATVTWRIEGFLGLFQPPTEQNTDITGQSVGDIKTDINAQSTGNISTDLNAVSVADVPIDITSSSIGDVPIDIQAATVGTLDTDISAQSVGDMDVNLAANSLVSDLDINLNSATAEVGTSLDNVGVANVPIDITSQSIADLDTNISSQSIGDLDVNLNTDSLTTDLDMNIASAAAQVDTNIAAAAATVDTNITSQSISELDMDISAQSIGDVAMDINSQSLSQVGTSMDIQSSIDAGDLNESRNVSLASQDREYITLAPPADELWQIGAIRFTASSNADASSGYHEFSIEHENTNMAYVTGSSTYNSDIKFNNNHFMRADDSQNPPSDTAQVMATKKIEVTDNRPLELIYYNATDAATDVLRFYEVQYITKKIA